MYTPLGYDNTFKLFSFSYTFLSRQTNLKWDAKEKMMSEIQFGLYMAYIHCCKYVGNLKNIDNLILYGQISSYYVVYQPSDTTKNATNCLN